MVEGLLYMTKNERFDKGVSVVDLKGNQRAGNKGLCDLLIFKHSLKRQLFQRGPLACQRPPDNTGAPFSKWRENDVEPRMKSCKAWMHEEASGNLTWRAGRAPSEIRRLSFVADTVFLGPCGMHNSS